MVAIVANLDVVVVLDVGMFVMVVLGRAKINVAAAAHVQVLAHMIV